MTKNLKYKIVFVFILNIIILSAIFFLLKNKNITIIKVNLITSTHSELPWSFDTNDPSLELKIGELTNIEYTVKNLSEKKTSGVASFAIYPNELKEYIIKVDCFCYDPQVLNPGETKKFILSVMIDPEVTKDSKTNSLNEAIFQFIFFDSKNYKKKI